jgi:predicted dithiol-disulfide oxidoreductase (DUF899 family)
MSSEWNRASPRGAGIRATSEVSKAMTTLAENGRKGGQLSMHTPPVVSSQEWKAAHEQLLVKEKALTRARDALAAERRRMPWQAIAKEYVFDGPAEGQGA